jgi:serine/threonine protein phosphatase 1
MPFLFREITDESVDRVTGEELELVRQWLRNGCMTTIQDLKACTQEERQDILEYIESFQLFEELTINNQAYVLVHGGLEHFDPDKPLEAYGPEDLLWTRTDYTKVYYPDKILVTGHTPTQLIGVGEPGRIYQGNNHIALDCGAAFGADLGCLCLETKEEFYI